MTDVVANIKLLLSRSTFLKLLNYIFHHLPLYTLLSSHRKNPLGKHKNNPKSLMGRFYTQKSPTSTKNTPGKLHTKPLAQIRLISIHSSSIDRLRRKDRRCKHHPERWIIFEETPDWWWETSGKLRLHQHSCYYKSIYNMYVTMSILLVKYWFRYLLWQYVCSVGLESRDESWKLIMVIEGKESPCKINTCHEVSFSFPKRDQQKLSETLTSIAVDNPNYHVSSFANSYHHMLPCYFYILISCFFFLAMIWQTELALVLYHGSFSHLVEVHQASPRTLAPVTLQGRAPSSKENHWDFFHVAEQSIQKMTPKGSVGKHIIKKNMEALLL